MIDEIKNEDFFALVAPDGSVQLATLADDKITCIALQKMYNSYGFGKSPEQMVKEGYTIQKVSLTITSRS